MSDNQCRLVVVGDVHPNREQPETLFEAVADRLQRGDLRMCQLECTISDKGVVRTDVRNPAHRVPPKNIKAITAWGFNVVTFAGNNNLDYGIEAFLDTIERLKSEGIAVVGAGENLDEARSPIFVQCQSLRIAFINFCSILRDGYAATSNRPGISPLKISTFYEPLENIYEQPGTPPRTVTIPDTEDFRSAMSTIQHAREVADVVIVAFHWGIHFTYDLAMYQAELGYAAIDAGADLILGTHPHCIQAIDVYKGRYIFYSLGNFAFEQQKEIAKHGVAEYLSFYGIPIDPSGVNPHPAHCRLSFILTCDLSKSGISNLRITPTYFTDKHCPEIQTPGSPKYEEIATLLKNLCAEVGTNVRRLPDGDLTADTEKIVSLDTRELLQNRKISYPHLRELVRT